MNYKKLINKALEAGISVFQVTNNASEKLAFTVFHQKIKNYQVSKQSNIRARGIYNGKLGTVSCERLDNKAIDYIINTIKEGATYIEKEEEPIIFKGSKKYHKVNTFNKELPQFPVDEKLNKLYELEKAAYAADPRVAEVEVGYNEVTEDVVLANSYGLSLKNKINYFYYYCEVVCKEKNEIKTSFELFIDNDFKKFNPTKLAQKVVKETVEMFDGISCKTKSYKCVLSPKTVGTFLSEVINTGLSAENIQKSSSVLVGKLNQKVFSNKLTVYEKPLMKNIFARYFDDEGVATTNKTIIDKGVIKTYLYNLETAKKDNVESTGNGYGAGKISISALNLVVKPGKKNEEELITGVKNGIYVKSVTGLHSGLNAESGDFSLEAEGLLIENGKISSPLKLITIGGNIYKLFEEIIAIGNNTELLDDSTSASSIAVKGLKVSSL